MVKQNSNVRHISDATRRDTTRAASYARMDGWKNILTGLGVKGVDRRKNSEIEWELMMEPDADEFFSGSDIARKIVTEVVDDGFREGYKLASPSITPDMLDDIAAEGERLQVDAKLAEAETLARMYGGAAIIPMPRDVKLLALPRPAQLPPILNLVVLSRWELPRQMIEVDLRDKNFAHPKSYRMCPRTGADQMNFEVHHSWVIRFDGAYLPRIKFFANNLWHDSILNVCKQPIRDYDAALSAVSAALDDFSVAVMSYKNLTASIAEDRDDLILKRLEIANLSRSIAKLVLIDADSEKFEYQNRPFTGVADAVRLVAGRLVVCSNMPHTKILGESPEGSNATGNSTTKDWYDYVKAWQVKTLDPKVITLWKWILGAKKSPTNGKVPNGLTTIYAPLWQEPASLQADIRVKQAQADQIYMTLGVLDPAEVAISRFGKGEYSTDTQLSDDRKDALVKDPKSAAAKVEPAEASSDSPGSKTPIGSNPSPGVSDPEADNKLEQALADV